ncbi:MAG: hypothetical protein RLZZ338_4396 [Cyanobacteriota bacterium]|jgi:hypothetical protein
METGAEGLEPPTNCLEGSYSIRLSYAPTEKEKIFRTQSLTRATDYVIGVFS